jgi:hypothetical protein
VHNKDDSYSKSGVNSVNKGHAAGNQNLGATVYPGSGTFYPESQNLVESSVEEVDDEEGESKPLQESDTQKTKLNEKSDSKSDCHSRSTYSQRELILLALGVVIAFTVSGLQLETITRTTWGVDRRTGEAFTFEFPLLLILLQAFMNVAVSGNLLLHSPAKVDEKAVFSNVQGGDSTQGEDSTGSKDDFFWGSATGKKSVEKAKPASEETTSTTTGDTTGGTTTSVKKTTSSPSLLSSDPASKKSNSLLGVPLKDWLILSFSYLGAHFCTIKALSYLPFPVQIVS